MKQDISLNLISFMTGYLQWFIAVNSSNPGKFIGHEEKEMTRQSKCDFAGN